MKKHCEHGYNGDCCCNCANQVKIMCHPWNGNNIAHGFIEDPIKIGKGKISDQLAWGCTIFLQEEGSIIYFDREHGICECHIEK